MCHLVAVCSPLPQSSADQSRSSPAQSAVTQAALMPTRRVTPCRGHNLKGKPIFSPTACPQAERAQKSGKPWGGEIMLIPEPDIPT